MILKKYPEPNETQEKLIQKKCSVLVFYRLTERGYEKLVSENNIFPKLNLTEIFFLQIYPF